MLEDPGWGSVWTQMPITLLPGTTGPTQSLSVAPQSSLCSTARRRSSLEILETPGEGGEVREVLVPLCLDAKGCTAWPVGQNSLQPSPVGDWNHPSAYPASTSSTLPSSPPLPASSQVCQEGGEGPLTAMEGGS